MIKGIIIGMLIWQGVAVLAYALSKENEEICCIWSMGIWRFISYYVISYPIYYIGKWIKRRRYVAMMIDPNGRPCYCCSSDVPELLRNIDFEWNHSLKEKYTIADGWNKDVCVCGEINVRYTPIKIAKAERAYAVSKDIIAIAKSVYENQ